jgi:histidinol-phosphate aminotransferase
VLLDANENPFGDGIDNRYPDPYQSSLRKSLAKRNNLGVDQVLFGNGSDELIDMLIRVFCTPRESSILVCPPTFGMYEVAANINDVATELIPLGSDYQLDVPAITKSLARVLFLPYPNAPTGNLFKQLDVEIILNQCKGLVVIDEAYVDFSDKKSWTNRLDEFPNLVVLQTFSKYWGLAGCRVGMVFASPKIIAVMSKIKMPYNLNNLSAKKALAALKNESAIRNNANIIISEREYLRTALLTFGFVVSVVPTQANFLWIKVQRANEIIAFLRNAGIIIRGYNQYPDFLRISVGLPAENKNLITTLKNYEL